MCRISIARFSDTGRARLPSPQHSGRRRFVPAQRGQLRLVENSFSSRQASLLGRTRPFSHRLKVDKVTPSVRASSS